VQAEFFFDHNDFVNYRCRQLGKEFLAEVREIVPPNNGTPQADFLLSTSLLQITEQEVNNVYKKDNIPFPTKYKVAFQDNLIKIAAVLTRDDRNNLILNSVEELTKLNDHPGNDVEGKSVEVNDFLETWYSTRAISAIPSIENISDSLKAKIDFPESNNLVFVWTGDMTSTQEEVLRTFAQNIDPDLKHVLENLIPGSVSYSPFQFVIGAGIPTGQDMPEILKDHFTIDVHGIEWQGPISSDQIQELKQYYPEALKFHETINLMLDSIDKIEFEQNYDVPPRPRPDSDLPGTFAIEIIYDEPRAWKLEWTGSMTESEMDELRQLPGDTAFKDGIEALIALIPKDVFAVSIALGNKEHPDKEEWPGTFEIEVTQSKRILKWTGPMADDEELALLQLKGDEVFKQGVIQLIKDVRSNNKEQTFEVSIEFAWPRVDKTELESRVKRMLTGLELPPYGVIRPIKWKGANNLDLDIDYFIARVHTCLREGDPFIQAFTNLLNQIQDYTFRADFWSKDLPLQKDLPDELKDNLLIGRQLIRCNKLLTNSEFEELNSLFESEPDKASLQRLLADLQDMMAFENIYQDWFSMKAVSKIPSLEPLSHELKELIDSPGPTSCTLNWEGMITEEERNAVLALKGDEPFKDALNKLVAAAKKAGENDITTQTAPLGPEQEPANLTNYIETEIGESTNRYSNLKWRGLLFDEQEVELKAWAQLSEIKEAVSSILAALDSKTITKSVTPARSTAEELPAIFENKLQISADELAWVGIPPTAEQLGALNDLKGDSDFLDAVQKLIKALTEDNGKSCVVSVTMRSVEKRPHQDDLADNLKDQLEIQDTQIIWKGRIHNNIQRETLISLTGDAPFKSKIQEIVTELENFVIEEPIDLAVRPNSDELPEILKEKLLIGKYNIRYHGLMIIEEGLSLQELFELETDKNAIERLFDTSTNQGMQGKELRIRARRGSAAPSALNSIESKKL